MSHTSDHPTNEGNCLKNVNMPIFLTNYDTSSTNKFDTWAYLRAPEWQINLNENKPLYGEIDRQMKLNVSYFELLPNELIRDLFEYLPVIDLFRSFYYLNQRFHQLVQDQFTQQACLRIDFSGLSLREFDFICNHLNPKQVEALTLGECDMNRIGETCTFGQIPLFLHRYHLSQFTSLKSLRIIDPYNDNQFTLLLNQLPGNQLEHLWIRFRKHSQRDLFFCLPFMDTIQSISLDQVTLNDLSKLSQMNFQQLQYLSIREVSPIFLFTLLRQMSRLRYLNVKLISSAGNVDTIFLNHNKFELGALTTLYVESNEISWNVFGLHLLSYTPNLRRLSLVGDYKIPVNLLVNQWKECFSRHTPRLTDFRFFINITLADRSSPIDVILNPFHEEFWQERKWYAAVDVTEEKNAYLYSLPCPRLYHLLHIISHPEHRLTTLPASSAISHSYFDSIKSLVISDIDQDIQTITTPAFYWNIRSLIINRSNCDMMLYHLIRLSSVRELTLSNSIDCTTFINLISMMTGLETLRLMEESQKILLLLKENTSLMQCLQKQAIRKLFLRNHYSVKDITNKTLFPINEFIQVFSNSLEFLYWRKPLLSIPIESVINGLSKLKSLTIIRNSNMKSSTYELTHWVQKHTQLKTFVIECENTDGDEICNFWL